MLRYQDAFYRVKLRHFQEKGNFLDPVKFLGNIMVQYTESSSAGPSDLDFAF